MPCFNQPNHYEFQIFQFFTPRELENPAGENYQNCRLRGMADWADDADGLWSNYA